MGKFTAYKLPLKSLGVGTHEFDYKLDKQFFANMEYADVRDADIDVHLIVDYHNDIYHLDFTLTGMVTLLCDRCLDDLVLPIDTTYSINVEYGDDYNDDSDDLMIIPESDNYLNVAYMLYDTVVLVIPIKHVHPLGKCNRAMSALLKKHRAQGEDAELEEELMEGIEDATPDPRWDALKGLGSDAGSDPSAE
ncbi:MAG: DUF177 domain-containing protein [Muribaculaceae bacterium]|nr:DUF177 domain-containing protein [Muribaculaceae bacterium]